MADSIIASARPIPSALAKFAPDVQKVADILTSQNAGNYSADECAQMARDICIRVGEIDSDLAHDALLHLPESINKLQAMLAVTNTSGFGELTTEQQASYLSACSELADECQKLAKRLPRTL